jgi:hypothetical protein
MDWITRRPFQSEPHRIWFWCCAVCLSVYMSAALYLCRSGLFLSAADTVLALILFILIAAAAFFLLTALSARPLPLRRAPQTRKRLSYKVFLAASGLNLAFLAVFVAADYPGAVSVDSAVQWTQAITNVYSNWHPVFHTLLLRLGYLIRPNYGFVVALQCGLYSLAAGYLSAVLCAWGIRAWAAILAPALCTLSPIVGNTMMYLWKDNAMTIGVVLLTAQTVNLYFSRGQWLKRLPNAVALGLALAFTTMVRHNAVLFTLPLLLAIALCCRKQLRSLLASAAVLAACLAFTWGPLYASLNVAYPNNAVEESVGVPMTVISDVRKANPGALDAETRAFTDQMADEDGWEAYEPHAYNSIKFGAARDAVARETIGDILRMAWNTARSDPRTAFLAVSGDTDLVWGVADEGDALILVRNSHDLPSVPVLDGAMNRIGKAIKSVLTAPFQAFPLRWYFGNIGVSFLLMLVAALWALRQSGLASLTLSLPVLLYNLGTMAVLCGKDARFFAFSPLLCTVLLFVLLKKLPDTREEPV